MYNFEPTNVTFRYLWNLFFVLIGIKYWISHFIYVICMSQCFQWSIIYVFPAKLTKFVRSPTVCNSEMRKFFPHLTLPIYGVWKVVYVHTNSKHEYTALYHPPEESRFVERLNIYMYTYTYIYSYISVYIYTYIYIYIYIYTRHCTFKKRWKQRYKCSIWLEGSACNERRASLHVKKTNLPVHRLVISDSAVLVVSRT